MVKSKAIFFWSGGKDSALALQKVLQGKSIQIEALVTTINKNYNRVSMHGVRESLLDKQAECIGIPLVKMTVQEGTNREYEIKFKDLIKSYIDKGVSQVIFGDIFLEDLKEYRDKLLTDCGAKGVYPLWNENTSALLNKVIEENIKTIVCCASNEYFTKDIVGKELTKELMEGYPNVDPCGENGEYHSFVYDAPFYSSPIEITKGEIVFKSHQMDVVEENGFWYIDLKLANIL